jgi:hypothetical protein
VAVEPARRGEPSHERTDAADRLPLPRTAGRLGIDHEAGEPQTAWPAPLGRHGVKPLGDAERPGGTANTGRSMTAARLPALAVLAIPAGHQADCTAASTAPDATAVAAAASAPAERGCPCSTPGRNTHISDSCPAATSTAAAACRVAAKFIQPRTTRIGRKNRSSRCTSGRPPGRTSVDVTAGRANTKASVATMNCHTPCCGRFAPRSDIVGQTASAATTSRIADCDAGSTSQPAAVAAASPASMAAARAAHAAAGTAVVPRTR